MRGAAGLIALWADGDVASIGTTPVALWGGTLRMQGRFVRGNILGRDASYEGALYERNRFGERRFVRRGAL